jgi:hypothetical protein
MDFDGIDDGIVGYSRPEKYAIRNEEYQNRTKSR